jgi:hypothetical protein
MVSPATARACTKGAPDAPVQILAFRTMREASGLGVQEESRSIMLRKRGKVRLIFRGTEVTGVCFMGLW